MRIGFITGITGQDGSYLAELLLEKAYKVYGLVRRASTFNTERIDHIFDRLELRYGDLSDPTNLLGVLAEIVKDWDQMNGSQRDGPVHPIEIYNLGAQSHVMTSFQMPYYTAQADALGTLNLLEAIRALDAEKKCRFYQASTSELFGKVVETPQRETTPFYPRSPYGVSKLYAYWIVKNYRESYGIFAANGILFNHESERRGKTFVTRKITWTIGQILEGKKACLYLGNLDSLRDWGYAPDYVEGMWRMLQQDAPDDFVLATGEHHSVREFVEKAFRVAGLQIEWEGEGVQEVGKNPETDQILVRIDPKYFRPAEVDDLLGDPFKAEHLLGWKASVGFDTMIEKMVLHDLGK